MSKIPTKRKTNVSSLPPVKVIIKDSVTSSSAIDLGEKSNNVLMTPVRFKPEQAQSFSLSNSAVKERYFSPVVNSATKDVRSAQKNYDVRNLRNKLFSLEKENLQLSSDCYRLSNEKKIVEEKLNQIQNGINFSETTLKQKLQKKQEELEKTVKLFEDKERCLEFTENKLHQLKIDLEKDLDNKTSKLEELQNEVVDLKDSLRTCELKLKTESSCRENDKQLYKQLLKAKNEELIKAQEQNSKAITSTVQAQELEELKNELQDAKLKIKEYEASEIINSANKCLESQVRDLKKELRAKEMQSEALKEHTQNIFLLREEKASLEQTIKGMKARLEELTPMEEKWNQSREELSKWKRLECFIPQIVNPNDVITRIQELSDELTSVKNQLVTLNDQKLKEKSSDTSGFSFLEASDPNSVACAERSEFEKDICSLRESKLQLETELRSVKKKVVLLERQRDSANSVLSSYEKEFETSEDQSLKIIEHLRLENQAYKDMAEEYDVTVKELRGKLEQLYTELGEAKTLNESIMKSREFSASFLNQSEVAPGLYPPSTPKGACLTADPLTPVSNQTLTPTAAVNQQEASPKKMKVLTLKHDLVLQTKLHFISELNDLKSENNVLKKKIVGMEAEKHKLMEDTRAAFLNDSNAAGSGVGEQTMAFCVKSTDEYKRMEKEFKRANSAMNGILERQMYMKEIFCKCFGFEFQFQPKENECVNLLPIFRPYDANSTKDYQIRLERIGGVWSIMDIDNVVYNTYSHLFQDLCHSAPFFAHVICDLYKHFDLVDSLQSST